MTDTKDILLKAAEDVQSGMWCKRDYFVTEDPVHYIDVDIFDGTLKTGAAQASKRCAHGSLALATRLLGGDTNDYRFAADAAVRQLWKLGHSSLVEFNDDHLPDDPFEAGQQLAELFRTTAESL